MGQTLPVKIRDRRFDLFKEFSFPVIRAACMPMGSLGRMISTVQPMTGRASTMANMAYTLKTIEIKVLKKTIISHLKTNKKKFLKELKAALKLYKEVVEKELLDKLEDHRAGKRVDLNMHIPYPKDHSAEYDKLVAFFSATKEADVTITKEQWDAVVNDEWDFRVQASDTVGTLNAINSKYLS